MTKHGTSMWNELVTEEPERCAPFHVERVGGTVHEPPREVPDIGRLAMFSDPSGGRIYVIEPATTAAR